LDEGEKRVVVDGEEEFKVSEEGLFAERGEAASKEG
jgi:hypothetical protein